MRPVPLIHRRLLVLLVACLLPAPRAPADAIVVTRAMTATTIAEIFVEADAIRVQLEIGLADLAAFRNVMPDELYERMGHAPAPLAERVERFFAEDLVIRADDRGPLAGQVVRVEPRPRVRRDAITGEPIPVPDGDPELVIVVELVYPLTVRPATLSFSPPFREDGRFAAANIGFVVYHRGLAVNDFRYLGAEEVLDLDWTDPWYSHFRNRNLIRQFAAPVMGFLYVDAFEVRQEIIARPTDLQQWVDLGLADAETIPADRQPEIKAKVAAFLAGRNPVHIDGELREPVLDRIHFIRRTLRTTGVVDPPEDLPVVSATLGVIFVYPVTGLPQEVTMEWQLFGDRFPAVPTIATDEAGGLPFTVTPDDPVLKWQNFLVNPTSTALIDLAPPPEPRRFAVPVLSAVFFGFALACLVVPVRPRSRAAGFLILVALGAATLPLARVTIRNPWAASVTVAGADAQEIVTGLLRNVYRAFDYREEGVIYDVLDRSAAGDLLTEIYLETMASLELENQGGARAKVTDVEMLAAETTNLSDEVGFETRCTWNVAGSVGHWGHIHQRRNQYEAVLTVKPVDGAWKVTDLELLSEQRLQRSMIGISQLEFRYGEGQFVLRLPDLEIERGSTVAFTGPSGSGKTTLLHLVAGILAPQAGRITVDGRALTAMGAAARRDFRIRTIGLVFQEFELLEYLSVLDNVLLPYRISPALDLDRGVRDRALELARRVGIADQAGRLARRLSQGERQRVAICRAVLPEPKLLLADEPTGNLDPSNKDRVLDIFFAYARDTGTTLVAVTHDRDILGRFDRVVDFKAFGGGGRVVSSVLYLAWRYLAYHRYKSAVLLLSITLIVYIPVGLRVLVRQSEAQLTRRAEATPLLVGAKGSPLELALNALYFGTDVPETIRYAEAVRVAETGLARAIPLSVRFRAREDPVVGTTLDYFAFRGLRVAQGRQMTRLGDCVLGAALARTHRLGPGDSVTTSPESVFDLAGVYPLRMRITGVLAPADSPDDHAIFVDVKTTWIIEGLAHGHEDLARPEAAPGVLRRDENVITANASVVQYNEITDENVGSFHFHGDTAEFPITAVIAVPHDDKSAAILMGRYLSGAERHQVLRPAEVMDELLATILTVQSFVVAAVIIVGAATLATASLVVLLSLRLRRREIETMVKIGGSRGRIVAVLSAEVVGVAAAAVGLAFVLTWMTSAFGSELIRSLLLS